MKIKEAVFTGLIWIAGAVCVAIGFFKALIQTL